MLHRRSDLLMEHREHESVWPRRAHAGAIAAIGAWLLAWSPMPALAAAPTPAKAPEAAAEPTPATSGSGHEALRVNVDPHIEDAARIPGWVASRSANVLDRLGEQPGHQRWVEVQIGGETYAYRVTVTAMRDGKPVSSPPEPVVCECTSEELLGLLENEVRRAVEELERPVPQEPAEQDPRPNEPDPPVGGNDSKGGRDELTWRGKLGIGLTAVGGSGVIAGVAMILAGEQPLLRSGAQIVESRDWRNPTGYVFLGLGVGILASGATLWVLDARPPKPSPKAQARVTKRATRRHAWAAVPWFTGRGDVGLGVVGRFGGKGW